LRVRVTTSRGSWFTVNVGTGGFCAELMRALSVGGHVEGLIHLPGRDVSFAGRVAWARDGDPRLSEQGRMGVCFLRVDPEFAPALADGRSRRAAAPA